MSGRPYGRPPGLLGVVRVAARGVTSIPGRAALSAAGVAIGIAVMVAVLGIAESSQADLLAELDRLGTNLLVVTPGRGIDGQQPTLPAAAPAMIRRIGAAQQVSATYQLGVTVRRSNRIDPVDTGGLTVAAASDNLLTALRGTLRSGRFLDPAVDRYPAVVLGAAAASRLGIDLTDGRSQVWIDNRSFTVVGLASFPLTSELDTTALMGVPMARALAFADPTPTSIYLRTTPEQVPAVARALANTADPAHPEAVSISRPSDALSAGAAAKGALTSLFFGLAVVALVVGGLGIANVMIVTVLERRAEIGLRRALGATKRDVGAQFLAEATLLSIVGAIAGAAFGVVITLGWAKAHHATVVLPPSIGMVIGAAVVVGALAGLYPARRAVRMDPIQALASD